MIGGGGQELKVTKAFSASLSVFLVAAFTLMVTTEQAHAYIDLGSGSFMLQMLLAGVFASLFAIKVAWHRLTDQVSRFVTRFRATKTSNVE